MAYFGDWFFCQIKRLTSSERPRNFRLMETKQSFTTRASRAQNGPAAAFVRGAVVNVNVLVVRVLVLVIIVLISHTAGAG